jgi:hypothetical protein
MTLALMFLAMLALGILLLGRVSRVSRAEDDGINARVRKITGAPRVLRDDSSLGLYCELGPELEPELEWLRRTKGKGLGRGIGRGDSDAS